jgi:hypothetical protein
LPVVAVLLPSFEVLSAPPVLSAALDRVDALRPFDGAVLLDAGLAVFAESLAAEPELDDGPDSSADDPLAAGVAEATCWPVKNAAPIPRATASPPTRPTYLAALMISSLQPVEWSPGRYASVIKITARRVYLTATTQRRVSDYTNCRVTRNDDVDFGLRQARGQGG